MDFAGLIAFGLPAGFVVILLVIAARSRTTMKKVGDENTAAVRENTAAVREHTEVLRQYLALKVNEAK